MATHHFEPTHYFTTMGSHEPVLRIQSGDTVITTTVDARGQGVDGSQITPRGNPQTGPFFIEGAEPGDTLVVYLEKLQPNRSFGWTASSLASNVVDPEYVRELPEPLAAGHSSWHVDLEAGTATLQEPATSLNGWTVGLDPMVGCFGVAPAGGEAISTATSAQHGGNMDYRGFREGVKVFFPVLVPGALFFLGDGHALQGDGEIAGTGIEISMNVQFRVELIKNKQITWPRGENEDYIFTVGNARPLDQCVQHATSEMMRWLQSDYGMDARGASIFLGQAVEYDLGNMFDPAYTMVCKVPKRLLPKRD
jgi:amidase